jgi:integrase
MAGPNLFQRVRAVKNTAYNPRRPDLDRSKQLSKFPVLMMSRTAVTLDPQRVESRRINEKLKEASMIRRRYQVGSLELRNGVYRLRYRIDVIRQSGKVEGRERKSITLGRITRREALRKRQEFLAKHGLGDKPRAEMALSDYWNLHYWPNAVDQKKDVSTKKFYTSLFKNHIEPVFGKVALGDIKRFSVEAFLSDKLKEGYASQTVHHLRNVLSKALQAARRWEWIEENPARMIELGKVRKVRPARTLSLEEVAVIAQSLPEGPRAVFVTGVFFGLRIGEVLGLKVADVDFEHRILKVVRSDTRGVIKEAKGPEGKRQFRLPELALQILRHWLTVRGRESEWLFPTRTGGVYDDRTYWNKFVKPVADRLGLPHWSWHSMRHTFLTFNGLREDLSLPVLQSLAGHASPETTMQYIDKFWREKTTALEAWAEKLAPLGPMFNGHEKTLGQVAQ